MIYQVTLPHPALRPYVKEYLLIDFDFTGLAEIPTKLLPARAEQSLIFYPGDVFTKVSPAGNQRLVMPHTLVQGQPLSTWHHHYPRRFTLLKVIFQPGGLYQLLGQPLGALTDAALDAESVLGAEIGALIQRLMNTALYGEMRAVVDGYLVDRFRRRKLRVEPIDRACQWLQGGGPAASVEYLAGQACLSLRQFERKFRERAGVSPKLFMRIQRFNRAFDLKARRADLDWLAVALACGYADYQHMVKDFRQFAGTTPVGLLEADATAPERVLHLR